MLDPLEEERMVSALPSSFDVEWNDSTYTYGFETWWDNEDHANVYPELILDWNIQGAYRSDERSMNQVQEVNTNPDDSTTIDTTVGDPVYDELVLQPTVGGTVNSDGVPAKIRSAAFAKTVWKFFRFSFDQNSTGPNGERPVLARVDGQPVHASEAVGDEQTDRYQITVRLLYSDETTKTEDAVDAAEGSVDVETDGTSWRTEL